MLLEQTIIRYWSERLDIEHLEAAEKRSAILKDPSGGLLLRSIERWLYQPSSLILSSEVTKVLAPYFKVPAPVHDANDAEAEPDMDDDADDDENGADEESDDEKHDLETPQKVAARKVDPEAEDEDEEDGAPDKAGRSAADLKPKTVHTKAPPQRGAKPSEIKARP
jgi:hypothetical protein